jgi:hypothetical protein
MRIRSGALILLAACGGRGAVVIGDGAGDAAAGDATVTDVTPDVGFALPDAPVAWDAPIVISAGGTYTGNWQSLDRTVPAVTITTSEPVTITDANIASRGELIQVSATANLTVTRTRGYGLNPNHAGAVAGHFVNADSGALAHVDVEHCTFTSSRGIYLQGPLQSGGSIAILNNRAIDVDGRLSDGSGGWQLADNTDDDSQFLQIGQVASAPAIEVGWNEVDNDPFVSRTEDVISIFQSSGTAGHPISIHDNFIRGSYPSDPAHDEFSGGGIMAGDSTGCGYISVMNNIVVATTNYGISCTDGHDVEAAGNRVVSSGRLPDGTAIAANNVGMASWNANDESYWANISMHDNVYGWMNADGRNDAWFPSPGTYTNNTAFAAGAITRADEDAEATRWQQKLAAATETTGAP